MNEFGNFLYSLRKGKGITQAELAQMLGVTNKAVSKWETGEAMPETGLLLPLSRIFDVSVDELLAGRRKAENDGGASGIANREIGAQSAEEETALPQNKQTLADKICGAVCATVFLCGLAVYLFMGAFGGLWNPYWVIIPSCAFTCGIIGVLFDLCSEAKRNKKLREGKNPYADAACGLIVLVSFLSYLISAVITGLWHPLWLICVLGVAACAIAGAICKIFR